MEVESQGHLLRFDTFEIDLHTRELRQQSRLLKLQDLPIRLLILLASRPGVLVTREEIESELWDEDHFVDFEHGINTAMRKVREALGDTKEAPRFIETLPRKGYRFIAAVERGSIRDFLRPAAVNSMNATSEIVDPEHGESRSEELSRHFGETSSIPVLAVPPVPTRRHEEDSEQFALETNSARHLFLLSQAGYLAMYCVTLFKLEEASRVLDRFFGISASTSIPILIAVAVCGIAVRLFLFTAVALKHPNAGLKFSKLFPAVFLLDIVWAATPLLLVEKLGMGLSMASVAGLAYLPFSQRILMQSLYPSN